MKVTKKELRAAGCEFPPVLPYSTEAQKRKERIAKLAEKGLKPSDIARAMEMHVCTVSMHLRALGRLVWVRNADYEKLREGGMASRERDLGRRRSYGKKGK